MNKYKMINYKVIKLKQNINYTFKSLIKII